MRSGGIETPGELALGTSERGSPELPEVVESGAVGVEGAEPEGAEGVAGCVRPE
ncbi:MAG: hypothetical protein ABL998_14155 [Planctomycetota bacterium]